MKAHTDVRKSGRKEGRRKEEMPSLASVSYGMRAPRSSGVSPVEGDRGGEGKERLTEEPYGSVAQSCNERLGSMRIL